MVSAFSNRRLSSMITSNLWISRSCAFRISAGTSMPCEGVISFEGVLGTKLLISLALRLIPSAAALAARSSGVPFFEIRGFREWNLTTVMRRPLWLRTSAVALPGLLARQPARMFAQFSIPNPADVDVML